MLHAGGGQFNGERQSIQMAATARALALVTEKSGFMA